jgi:hypothetical protein
MTTHRHRFSQISAHRVSDGVVAYHRCGCGRWRITRTAPGPTSYDELATIPTVSDDLTTDRLAG